MDYYSTKFLKDNDLGEGLKKILHQYYEVIKIMKKELIKFIDISKSYGNHLVLDEFNLSAAKYPRSCRFLT